MKMKHKFVEFVPENLKEGVLYISIEYGTINHNCACGCGLEVVTPISPADWQLNYNGETVSLYPSIGNWDYPCKSHYWIRKNKIVWAGEWTSEEIERGRLHDKHLNELHINSSESQDLTDPEEEIAEKPKIEKKRSWLRRLFFWSKP